MKVIVAGSRTIENYSLVEQAIVNSGFDISEVICGMCRGVDELGASWAFKNGILVSEFPVLRSDWSKYGNRAGPRRNKMMAEYAGPDGGLILIWRGTSPGSRSMLAYAEECGLQIYQNIVKEE